MKFKKGDYVHVYGRAADSSNSIDGCELFYHTPAIARVVDLIFKTNINVKVISQDGLYRTEFIGEILDVHPMQCRKLKDQRKRK